MCTTANQDSPCGRWRRYAVVWLLMVGLAVTTNPSQAEQDGLAERMLAGGHVLLLRHADAPGTGDPPGFRLGDCSTQRNLSETGRAQARVIGTWLRERGVGHARVYSSQWCRCLETAELLALGPVTPLPALNSFYARPQDREPNLAALKEFLAGLPSQGELLILVTHQVTVSALTGEFVASGEGVLTSLADAGVLTPVGSVDFGW